MSYLTNPYRYGVAFPDPHLWYDFSDVSTITKDGSNLVLSVENKGDAGFDSPLTWDGASSPIVGAKPLWVSSGQNGNNDIDFAGNKLLATDVGEFDIQLHSPYITFVVCEASDNSGTDRSPLGFIKDASYQGDFYCPRTYLPANNQFYFHQIGLSEFTETGIIDTWHVWTSICKSGASSLRMDGVEKASNTSTGSNDPKQMLVGTNHLANSFLDRPIGEIKIYNEELTIEQIETIEGDLETKWGTP